MTYNVAPDYTWELKIASYDAGRDKQMCIRDRSRCPATAVREEMTEAAITQVITAAKKLKKRDRRVLGRE